MSSVSIQPCELGWKAEPAYSAWTPFHRKCLERKRPYNVGDIIDVGDVLRSETCHLILTNCRIIIRPELVNLYEQLTSSSSDLDNQCRGRRLEGPSGSGKLCSLIYIIARHIYERKTFLYFNHIGVMYLISPEGVYTYTRPTFEGYEACVQPLLPPESPRLWALIASRYNGFVTDVPLNLLTPELFLVYASSTSSCNHKPLLDNSTLDGPPIVLKPWSPRELRKYLSKLIQIHGRRIGPKTFTKIYVTFGPNDRDILRALYEVEKGKSRKKNDEREMPRLVQ